MEHAGTVVPVGERSPVRPVLADDVVEAELRERRERLALRCGDVRLTDVGGGVEHVVVGRRDIHVAADDGGLRRCRKRLAERCEPRELVGVMVGTRHTSVRHVDRRHAEAGARRRQRPRLQLREPGGAGQPGLNLVEADARQDRNAVP